MKNILKKDYVTATIIGISIITLSGCTKEPVINHKPVVTVPSDKMINIGEPITLTATASDKDKEDILKYKWRISAKPKESKLTLKDATKKTISITADKPGTYYLDFIAKDEFTSSKSKRVTILATSLVGEWRADLAKTKKENKLNDDENSELVEVLSSNYKIIFLENGKVEGDDSSSWKHKKNKNYTLNNKELKLIDENQLFIIDKIKEKDVKLFYKRVLKK